MPAGIEAFSPRKEETRLKSLEILITSCANKEVIPPLKWSSKKS
jgi:hypothetical protein